MTCLEIIEALVYCLDKYDNCDECPCRENLTDCSCVEMLRDDVIALFKGKQARICELERDVYSQKADIEQWQGGYMAQKQEIANLEIELKAMRGAANSYKAEIERLSVLAKLGNMRANDYRAMRDKCKNAKAEAIKEFAERLKEDVGSFGKHITVEDVDNLVKEMVGDQNDHT